MTHVRDQIRQAVRTVLAAQLPGFDVFSSRKNARNALTRPMIDMRFLNENVDQDTMGPERRRTASLYIRVQRQLNEEAIDAALDADEIAINTALLSADWTGLLEDDPRLMQVNWSDDPPVYALVLRYDVEYRVRINDLETVRE